MGTLIITSIAILFIVLFIYSFIKAGKFIYSFIKAGKFANQFEKIYEDEIIKNSFGIDSKGNISDHAIQACDLNNVYKNIA